MIEWVNFLDVDLEKQMQTRHWRNAPHVTKFFQRSYIDEETHRQWLHQLKQNKPQTIAFLIRLHQKDIGVTYFHSIDYLQQKGDWGIYIYEEESRGRGIGKKTLLWCLDYAKNQLRLKNIFLEVLENNHSAQKLYEKVGFQKISQSQGILRYQKEITNDNTI